ncbi:MAG: DUF1573 domain-containing protein [Planctomycetaceae bacterium]|nr:DUF1573 domain-containing protein [Planctomycetaceae bacterium]
MSRCGILTICFFAAAFAFFCPTVAAQLAKKQWAEDMFELKSYDFGCVSQGAKAEFLFKVRNPYNETVHIRSVSSSCLCTSVSIDRQTLATYESANILAHFNAEKFLGSKSATITVEIDQPYRAVVHLSVRGQSCNDVAFAPGVIDFGSVMPGSPPEKTEKKILITYTGGNRQWNITELKNANPNILTELTEVERNQGAVRYLLKAELSPDSPSGYLNDRIFLVTNERSGREIPIMVQGLVRPTLTVSPDSLYLGTVAPGQEVVKKLIVRSGKPFEIKNVTCGNKDYQFDVSTDDHQTPTPRTFHLIVVKYQAPERANREEIKRDIIQIDTNLQAKPLEVPAFVKFMTEQKQ